MPRAEPKVAELMTSHIGHTVVAGVHYAVETQTSRYRICPTTAIVGR